MQVCKLAAKVAVRHWHLLLIYVVALTAAAVAVGSFAGSSSNAVFEEEAPKVAVVDRDGSELSRALAAYTLASGTPVEVEDSAYGLQDAAAKDRASYVLVIPEGFGEGLVAAARAGEDSPVLETVISYQSSLGALMDERVRAYASALYGFAAATDADAAQIAAWADEATAESASVAYAEADEVEGLSEGYLAYAAFTIYSIFVSIVVFVPVCLAPLERSDTRRRLHASPVSSLSFGVQAGAACVAFGLAVWAFEAAVGLAAFGWSFGEGAAAPASVVVSAQLAYALFAVAVGVLLWRLRAGEAYVHGVANAFATLFSFMGGAWVPLDMLGEAVANVARFTPGYWVCDAFSAASDASVLSGEALARVGGDLGIVALFAVAVLAAALAVGRARLRERGA